MRVFSSGYSLAAAISVISFILVPIFIVSNNVSDLYGLNINSVLIISGLYASISFLFITIAIRAAQYFNIGPAAYVVLLYVLCFVTYTGFVFPLTGLAGQVEIRQIPFNWANLAFAVASSLLTMALISVARIRGALIFGAAIFFASNAGLSYWALRAIEEDISVASKSIFDLSSEQNVVVLSFDGLPGPVAAELLREDHELSSVFRDFVMFENVISSSPATAASLASSMAGDMDLKGLFGTESRMWKQLDPDLLITNHLTREGYKVSTFSTFNYLLRPPGNHFGSMRATKRTTYDELMAASEILDYSIARVFSPFFGRGQSAISSLLSPFNLERSDVGSLERRVKNHVGGSWDAPYVLKILDFENYRRQLATKSGQFSAHFIHLTHTHFPVDFDKFCAYQSDSVAWFRQHQNRAGVEGEVKCALGQMASFVLKLREFAIYENTLIVLMSDHGQPVSYGDPGRLESFSIRGHPYWGMGRYLPFLAIKGFGQRGDGPKFDKRPAILSDLARSICEETELNGCERYKGYNLFDKRGTIPKDATYFVNIVENASSTFKMDGHESVKFRRTTHFLDSLNAFLTSELLTSSPVCGTSIRFENGKAFNNGRSDYATWVDWSDGKASFLKFRSPNCADGAPSLELRVTSNPMGPTEYFINGQPSEPISTTSQRDWNVVLIPLSDLGAAPEVTLEVRSTTANPVRPPNLVGMTLR